MNYENDFDYLANLKIAFNLSDKYYFYKVLKIFKAMYEVDYSYCKCMEAIVDEMIQQEIKNSYDKAEKRALFLKNIMIKNNETKLLEKFTNFIKDNENCFIYPKDDYDNYDDTKKELIDLLNGIYDKDKLSYYYYNDLDMYKNKLVGILGELHVWKNFKNLNNSMFVARDYGNGFGYDIYYNKYVNNTLSELLLEIKSTINDKNDIFYLTNQERKTLEKSLKFSNSIYEIGRVKFNINNDKTSYIQLGYDNSNDIFYSKNHEYIYERSSDDDKNNNDAYKLIKK